MNPVAGVWTNDAIEKMTDADAGAMVRNHKFTGNPRVTVSSENGKENSKLTSYIVTYEPVP